MSFRKALFPGVPIVLLICGCSDPRSKTTAPAAPAAPTTAPGAQAAATPNYPAPDVHPAPLADVPPIVESASPVAPAIDKAAWTAQPMTPEAKKDALVRAEVLLARAHFSPGVIDGQDGGNLKNAIAAFEEAHGIPVDGRMDDQVWQALAADTQPALTDYVITEDDLKGPFPPKIPTDMAEMAKLDALGFTSPAEE